MILTGNEIQRQKDLGNIIIQPFCSSQISTNSYDLRLSNTLIKYKNSDAIDPKIKQEYIKIEIPDEGFLINKGEFYLGTSLETIGSNDFVPILHAKSGTARMGLFVHITADLIDIGSIGKLTFQLYATLPVIVYPNMLLAQVTFWKTFGEIKLYDGKYQNSTEPRISQIYKDFV